MSTGVVCFGELMMRLSPPGNERFLQSPSFRTWFGGSEANVALGLAHLGRDSTFVTALPQNPLGDAALSALRSEGVNTAHVVRSGARLGIYFVESGADIRPMRVVYDRAHSAFATLNPAAIDWSSVLQGASWLHLSGITPALGDGPSRAALDAATTARAMGVRVSLDLNHRPALWAGRDPVPHVRPLGDLSDLVIGNAGAVRAMLGIAMPDETGRRESQGAGAAVSPGTGARTVAADVAADEAADAAAANDVDWQNAARRVHEVLGCGLVAFTRRDSSSASRHGWSAVLFDGTANAFHSSREWSAEVVDRVGGGDSFAAALIHAVLNEVPLSEALEFATAASALKLTIAGDFNRVSTEEVTRLLGNS